MMQNNKPQPPLDTILGNLPVSAVDFLNYTIGGEEEFQIFSADLTPITGNQLQALIKACNARIYSSPKITEPIPDGEELLSNYIAYLPSSLGLCCSLQKMISIIIDLQIIKSKKQDRVIIYDPKLQDFID